MAGGSKKEYYTSSLIAKKFIFFSQRLIGAFLACMFWMVQGDFRLISSQHWYIGIKTAFISSTILLLASFTDIHEFTKDFSRRLIFTSIVVALVDHFIHPSHFGGKYSEAIATGLTAASLVALSGLLLKAAQKK